MYQVILDDLRQLQVHYDHFSRTSDHFDYLLQCAEDMIKKSLAYVDDTPQEEMQKEREQRVPSRHRESSKILVKHVGSSLCQEGIGKLVNGFFFIRPFCKISQKENFDFYGRGEMTS